MASGSVDVVGGEVGGTNTGPGTLDERCVDGPSKEFWLQSSAGK